MKFNVPLCPECSEPACGLLEELQADANIDFDEETNEYNYTGNTDMYWDTQQPIETPDGRVSLICPNHHEWLTGRLV